MMLSELLYKIKQMKDLCNDGMIDKKCIEFSDEEKERFWDKLDIEDQNTLINIVMNTIDDYKKYIINILWEKYPEFENILNEISDEELFDRYVKLPYLLIDFLITQHGK